MKHIYTINSFKIVRIGFLHKIMIMILLILLLRSEKTGPHDFLNIILNYVLKSLNLLQKNENGLMMLIVFWLDLNDIKRLRKVLVYRNKTSGTLMRQDFE